MTVGLLRCTSSVSRTGALSTGLDKPMSSGNRLYEGANARLGLIPVIRWSAGAGHASGLTQRTRSGERKRCGSNACRASSLSRRFHEPSILAARSVVGPANVRPWRCSANNRRSVLHKTAPEPGLQFCTNRGIPLSEVEAHHRGMQARRCESRDAPPAEWSSAWRESAVRVAGIRTEIWVRRQIVVTPAPGMPAPRPRVTAVEPSAVEPSAAVEAAPSTDQLQGRRLARRVSQAQSPQARRP
jgi:hypothetical protein